MFVRRRHNKSGTISIQIIERDKNHTKIVKHIGTAKDPDDIEKLIKQAEVWLNKDNLEMFNYDQSTVFVAKVIEKISSEKTIYVGYTEVFGTYFDKLGFSELNLPEYTKEIVIARIVSPDSKLSTSRWLKQKLDLDIDKGKIYRLMDKLTKPTEILVTNHTFEKVKNIVGGEIHMVFFDATTLHFETFKSDDFRKCGYSKVGKHNQPQIVIGLMVTKEGLPIGYDVFPGNKFDGHTIRSALTRVSRRYNVPKVTFVADAGMMSKENIQLIESRDFNFIMSAKLHSLTRDFQEEIFAQNLHLTGKIYETKLNFAESQYRLVVTYSENRALQDKKLRDDQIIRLKKTLASKVKVTKTKVGKIGKSKYIRVVGNASVEIDYESILEDAKWDGLKGYITNIPKTELSSNDIVARYTDLWEIEKAFRISKQDLRVRPIFHFKRSRIRAHILLVFISLVIVKYIEYLLKEEHVSVKTLIEHLDSVQVTEISHPLLEINMPLRSKTTEYLKAIYEVLQIETK